MDDLLRVLVVVGLVGVNAFFVVGEYAVLTARRAALSLRAERGAAGACAALRLMDDPVRVISTAQVGITAVAILTGAVGEPLVQELLGGGIPPSLSFLVAFAIVTYLSVVLGELVPKALTLHRAEALASLVARPIELVGLALRPLVWLLQRSAGLVLRPLGIRTLAVGATIGSVEELRAAVDEAESSGIIPQAQEELLHNAFEFVGREARDVMVPAAEVAWLDAALDAEAALGHVVERPHSRYPVGRGSLDRLVGVVHLRELLAAARHDPPAAIAALARPAPIVPETKDLGALLRELREGRQQLAVIADEYGSTAGIVTLEDLLEELVGEIEDEYDLPDATLAWVGDDAVLASGSMTIDDFNESVGTALPQDGSRTLAGLAFDALGRGPRAGDTVAVAGARLTVEQLDGARIARLRIRLPTDVQPPKARDAGGIG